MKTKGLIKIQEFCGHYQVPHTFIESLFDYDLIEVVVVQEEKHIEIDKIDVIEKLMRLHYDLDINFEGLDVITNLLDQINTMQEEVLTLKNKLTILE